MIGGGDVSPCQVALEFMNVTGKSICIQDLLYLAKWIGVVLMIKILWSVYGVVCPGVGYARSLQIRNRC